MKKFALKALFDDEPYDELLPLVGQARKSAIQPRRRESNAAAIQGNMTSAFLSSPIAETGVDPKEIEDSTSLSELGVDSLMGIAIMRSNGSASIYFRLLNLASSTPIWVLESPFLDCPSDMTCTTQEIAPIYMAALKAI
ncbi:hypothetical protein GQX73_g6065 [Xylaria multiplex]|uniref:Carrier domain-containing protein n=1 Tax=Xylaria multiplex TaxID=323545 RepID=A0A7C8MRB0_9PEZI|nr:hypothetical protein GQX73_g6065 [Xylaria multiplex]